MICEEVEELAGAYALGALPADELRDVEEHLASCSRHPDMADVRVVAGSLALAAPDAEPPSALKGRLMDAVRREAPPEPFRKSVLTRLERWLPQPLPPYALAGALAGLVLALLIWNISLQSRGDETLVRNFSAENAASGSVTYISDDQLAVLSIDNLDTLPVTETYQVWAIAKGKATGIGFLNVADSGAASAVIHVDLSDGQVIAITVEPAGGSAQPTSAPIIQVEI